MGKIIRNGIEYSSTVDTANNISYDNSLSGLEATTTQKAIDELNTNLTESLISFKQFEIEVNCNKAEGNSYICDWIEANQEIYTGLPKDKVITIIPVGCQVKTNGNKLGVLNVVNHTGDGKFNASGPVSEQYTCRFIAVYR